MKHLTRAEKLTFAASLAYVLVFTVASLACIALESGW